MSRSEYKTEKRVVGFKLPEGMDVPAERASRFKFAIAAYLGGSDKFDHAMTEFGETYADQTERDHAALADAVASGRVQAQAGV